ncbi:MAG TPA: energy transducer TonB [Gemmatimonadales bacterium]
MTDVLPRIARTMLALALLACGRRADDPPPDAPPNPGPRDQPPVPLDANPPVEYPPALYAQGVSGTVVLRLFVDEQGTIVADSTRIEESSGHAVLDSAAVAAVPRLRYAPALRSGRPVAAPFRQPIDFRHPSGVDTAGGTVPP